MTDEPNGSAPRADARQELADELQRLRVRSGKSLRELAASTHSSDSSLSRYLTGQVVPPWRTVETLCGEAGADPATVKALWSQARSVRILDQLQSQGPGQRSADVPLPPPPAPPHGAVPAPATASDRPGVPRRRSIRTAAAVIGVIMLMAATGFVVRQLTITSMEGRFARERAAAAAAADTAPLEVPESPRCQFSHSTIGKALWLEAFLVGPGGTLKRGEVCHIGRAYVTVDEDDGLTLRIVGRRDVEWKSSWFSPKGTKTDRAVFTADGRLSTYDAAGTELWVSHRPTRAAQGRLAIQTDGNLVIYSTDWQHLWAIR